MLEVKAFPQNLSDLEINRSNLKECLFAGLYEETVEVNGKSRKF